MVVICGLLASDCFEKWGSRMKARRKLRKSFKNKLSIVRKMKSSLTTLKTLRPEKKKKINLLNLKDQKFAFAVVLSGREHSQTQMIERASSIITKVRVRKQTKAFNKSRTSQIETRSLQTADSAKLDEKKIVCAAMDGASQGKATHNENDDGPSSYYT